MNQQTLFVLPDEAIVRFDGGARGNPGPAAYGYVVERSDGEVLAAEGEAIGTATNNVAEYRGLIEGLRRAQALGIRRVRVHGDSKLVIEQMKGAWRVRSPGLKPLHDEASALARTFDEARFEHLRRAGNSEADRLVNVALDEAAGRGL